MIEYILREGVLNDDLLIFPDDGMIFKGNYLAIIKKYTFLNAWSNKETIIRFRKLEKLDKFLKKHYPEFEQ